MAAYFVEFLRASGEHPVPWFNDRQGDRTIASLYAATNGYGPNHPIFWTERDVNHDKRCCQVGGSFHSDGIACCEWHGQCVRQDKNKSFDCHFKFAVLPQCACGRIGTNKRPRPPQRTVLLCALKSARGRSHLVIREAGDITRKQPQIETVGRQLRVWRDQGTNKIVIEPPVFAPKKKSDGLISLSAKHARHLASSLLLFAEEAESSPTFAAVKSPSQVAQEERAISRLEGTRLMLAGCKSDHVGRGVRPTNHAQQIRPIERPRGRKTSAPYL